MDSLLRLRRPASPTPAAPVTTTATATKPGGEDRQTLLTLMHLPPEIHLAISEQLIYPDALSLKHTNRHFYRLVDTGTNLKVEWLLQRRSLHLECPNDRRCDLGSDLRFCRGSVPLLMKRRREHMECDSRPGLGCLVYGTVTCAHRRRGGRWRRWLRARLTVEVWWVLMALVPLLMAWIWWRSCSAQYREQMYDEYGYPLLLSL